MNHRRLRSRSAAAALAVALACFTAPSLAQSDNVDPRQTWLPRASAPSYAEPLVSPFGIVHQRYEPSQPAPDQAALDQAALERDLARDGAEAPPARGARAHIHVRAVVAPPPPSDSGEADAPPAIESSPADAPPAGVPAPVHHRARHAAIEQPRPVVTPAGVTLREVDILRLAGIASFGALLVAAIGFAFGRLSRRQAGRPSLVAKTASRQSVTPADLAGPAANAIFASGASKQLRRGQPPGGAGPRHIA